jgi:hypothetical protein
MDDVLDTVIVALISSQFAVFGVILMIHHPKTTNIEIMMKIFQESA